MKSVSLAVWGLGEHAKQTVLPLLGNLPFVDLKGVWTRDESSRKSFQKEHGSRAYASPGEMLADSDLEVIYVATPTGLHFEHGLKVLKAGKNLWMEKSFTDSLEKTQKLVNIAKKKNLQLKECFMFMHHPHLERIHSLVNQNVLGEIGSLHACFGFPHRESDDFRYNPELGGGALLDAGVYPIHLLLNVTEKPAEEIFSHSVSSLYREDRKVDIRGLFSGSLNSRLNFCLEWGFGRAYRNSLTLWGEEKILRTNRVFTKGENYEPTIELIDSNQNKECIELNSANHFKLMFKSFHRDLRSSNHKKSYQAILEQSKIVNHIFVENEQRL